MKKKRLLVEDEEVGTEHAMGLFLNGNNLSSIALVIELSLDIGYASTVEMASSSWTWKLYSESVYYVYYYIPVDSITDAFLPQKVANHLKFQRMFAPPPTTSIQ